VSFTIHHMRLLMKHTVAWATIVTLLVGLAFRFRDSWNWAADVALPCIALSAWWTVRAAWLFRCTNTYRIVRAYCGLIVGLFLWGLWFVLFHMIWNLALNRMLPKEWLWVVPAVISGAVIGLMAGGVEVASRLAEPADARRHRILRHLINGAAIGGLLGPILGGLNLNGGAVVGHAVLGFVGVGGFFGWCAALEERDREASPPQHALKRNCTMAKLI
jgi:hypothetical protein